MSTNKFISMTTLESGAVVLSVRPEFVPEGETAKSFTIASTAQLYKQNIIDQAMETLVREVMAERMTNTNVRGSFNTAPVSKVSSPITEAKAPHCGATEVSPAQRGYDW